MILDIGLVVGGAALLVIGAELLVRGAAALARNMGVTPLVIGLTVVAYGTSAPELVVSVLASVKGNPAICGGNIVGSNILNILLVLGATALICPLKADAAFVHREVPLMVGATLLFDVLAYNGEVARWQAGVLVVLLICYTVLTVRAARRETKAAVRAEFEEAQPSGAGSALGNVALAVLGLVGLAGGSELFLRGAVAIAAALGVSDAVIGLTLVALGTSFPELAASLIAAWRKHPDICLGNIVGSCIYNLLAIGGLAGVVNPLPFDRDMRLLHLPIMTVSAIILWPLVRRGSVLSRRDGMVLLLIYAGYVAFVLARAI